MKIGQDSGRGLSPNARTTGLVPGAKLLLGFCKITLTGGGCLPGFGAFYRIPLPFSNRWKAARTLLRPRMQVLAGGRNRAVAEGGLHQMNRGAVSWSAVVPLVVGFRSVLSSHPFLLPWRQRLRPLPDDSRTFHARAAIPFGRPARADIILDPHGLFALRTSLAFHLCSSCIVVRTRRQFQQFALAARPR
jgi:hypothetical protein